ncbi:GNAT family N-acetyltransferase [Aquicoccus sp. G2-2]|uniref:GNAT family N-acetyltransferase n=1 Tax=Aquicoccus sp. G2-2 TaxID=3092120 RepID=UPI002AE056E7|nr:GNAT family N-acetyltransferase [Aquicoccus sp. G2-2]MEA1115217.1 GNAT family N-acetyltransferase [Aquicoccus sp. G2-2]
MGPRFLRAYYQAVLDFGASIALVAHDTETGGVSGFVVGFRDPQGFYALFGQRRKRMLSAILLAVLRDPGLVPQILRNMRRIEVQAQQPVDAVELSSIAVGTPGGGIGSMLLEAFVDKVRAEGADRILLTTDAEGNDPVRRFYEARCFTLDGYEDRGARRLCRYVRSLG